MTPELPLMKVFFRPASCMQVQTSNLEKAGALGLQRTGILRLSVHCYVASGNFLNF